MNIQTDGLPAVRTRKIHIMQRLSVKYTAMIAPSATSSRYQLLPTSRLTRHAHFRDARDAHLLADAALKVGIEPRGYIALRIAIRSLAISSTLTSEYLLT